MPSAAPNYAAVAKVIAAAVERNLRGLTAGPGEPVVRKVLKITGAALLQRALDLAPTLDQERGRVIVMLASPDAHTLARTEISAVLADVLSVEGWRPPTDIGGGPGTDLLRDPALRTEINSRVAYEAIEGLVRTAGGATQQLVNGWVMVTAVAAWDRGELVIRHASTLIEDTPPQ